VEFFARWLVGGLGLVAAAVFLAVGLFRKIA
jgi:hypothetical protein